VPADTLSALDAYLLGLVLDYCSEGPVLLDLAGDEAGLSTLLARTHPRVSQVVVSPASADRGAAWGAADRFLADNPKLEPKPIEVLPRSCRTALEDGSLARRFAGSELVALCDISSLSSDALLATAETLAAQVPESVLLVYPVARVGDCPHLQALVARYGCRSAHTVRVFREEGEFFGNSRLALVHRRDCGRVADGLERLLASYHGNCSYLDLMHARYMTAIEEAEADTDSLNSRGVNWLQSYEEEIAELNRQLEEKEEELQGIVPWFGHRLWRSCKWPVIKARNAFIVIRKKGLGELCKRVTKKFAKLLG
jgi:hypothetical protein